MLTSEWRRASEIVRGAHKGGADAIEALERAGLLLTARVRLEVKVDTVKHLAYELSTWRPDEILRKVSPGPWTPAEMLTAIFMFIEEYEQRLKEEQ